MKTMNWLLVIAALTIGLARGEEDWRKVAFIGDADVKSISGLVEVISGKEERVLHEKEIATIGQTLRIWRGAEVILMMHGSKSLVRAKGPVLLRLAPVKEGYDRASLTGEEPKQGFIVRAVHGHGKYQDGVYWRDLQAGMTIPEGARVRPFRDSVLDFYHPGTHTAYRITDHTRQTQLVAKTEKTEEESSPTILAAQNP
jgi:hypothetical protein